MNTGDYKLAAAIDEKATVMLVLGFLLMIGVSLLTTKLLKKYNKSA